MRAPALYIAIYTEAAHALRALSKALDRLSARMLSRRGIGVRTAEEDRHWSLVRRMSRG